MTLIFIERVNNPFTDAAAQIVFPDLVVWALTAFWFLGAMNTVNWLDGLDGLAAGVTAILSAVLVIHMLFRAAAAALSGHPAIGAAGRDPGLLAVEFQPGAHFYGQQWLVFPGLCRGRSGHHRRHAWPLC